MADSPINTRTPYKPGGTGHILQGEMIGRVEHHEKDRLGRWTCANLLRKDRKIAIFAAYQSTVANSNNSHITFHNQQRIMFKKEKTDPDEVINDKTPRKRFQKDFLRQVENKLKDGYKVLIMADFNEPSGQRSVVQHLIDLGLIDVWRTRYPQAEEPSTYQRGSSRLDFCLATPIVNKAIKSIFYTNFKDIANSDHRGIVMDLDHKEIFNKKSITEFHKRHLFSNDRKQVYLYLEHLNKHLIHNNAFLICEDLLSKATFQEEKLEKLDRIVSDAAISAERKLKTRRRPWWSSKLNTARYKVRLLRNHHVRLKQGFSNSPDLQFRMDNKAMNTTLAENITTSSVQIQEAKEELADIIKKAREYREAEQLERHNYLNRNGEKEKAKVIKLIRQKERLANAYRQIKTLRNPLSGQNVNRVDVPTQWTHNTDLTADNMEDPKITTEWTTITDVQEIEKFMILRNRKHFNQAEGTPLTTREWRELFDWAGSSETAQAITEGQYGTRGLEETHAAVIKACRKEFSGDLIDYQVMTEDFRDRIKHWRESTATSPSGRHLGHYRALVTSVSSISDQKKRESITTIQDSICQLLVDIINYTVHHKYLLRRWHRIESTMIPKDLNSVKIHRMRVIHIFEADYNLLLGLKWRQAILALENTTYLHHDQHGSRPGRSAAALPLQEELCYDISRCTRTNLCNFDNDATACYDRVVAKLASLAGKKHGIHFNLIAVNTRALSEVKYYIRSRLRKNKLSYQHSSEVPIHGTGQGCANSPTVWCTVSLVLFSAHNKISSGCSFKSPDLSVGMEFTMVGFVDDSTGRVNDFESRPQPTAFELTTTITNDAQHWHDILWFSGGKLELAKCSYHFISWAFKESGEPVIVEHPDLPNISLKTPNGNTIQIQRKSCYSPHKTLGHFKSPTSTLVVQLDKIKQKAEQISNALFKSSIPSDLIWTMYNSIYLSSIGYVLPQSNYSEKKLEKAQKRSMSKIIAKCGYNRTSCREVMYGPTYLGGAGFIPWSIIQGEGQVINFLQYWRHDSKMSNLLKISLAWAQYQSGMSESILCEVDRPLGYVEAKWMISLRRFLSKMEATLELDQTHCYPVQRLGDRHLMDIAYESGEFTSREMKKINYCCMHLQVTTVSDITNIQGNCLQSGASTGQLELLESSAVELQAIQANPHYKSWRHWVRLMRLIAKRDGALHQPLGRWLIPGNQLKRRWKSYYNTNLRHYSILSPDGIWKQHKPDGSSRRVLGRSWQPTQEDVPRVLHHTMQYEPSLARDPRRQSFQEFLLERDYQNIFDYIQLYRDPYDMAHFIANSLETLVVSDGSSKHKCMAQGWVLATAEHGVLAEGAGPGYGVASSHRAEGYSMAAATLFVRLLQEYTDHKFPNCQFQCDNSGLITILDSNLEYNQIFSNQQLTADRDQINHILDNLSQFEEPKVEHVKGHQDENSSELDLVAQLNVRADALAGWYHQQHPKRRFKATVSPQSGVHLHIRGKTINSNYRQHIRNAVHGPAHRRYLCEKHQWGDEEAANVDWEQFAHLNHSLRHLRVWKTKFINDLLPTVRRTATWSYNRPPCDCCCVTDTWQHYLRCPLDDRRKAIRQFMRRLASTLGEYDTDPELQAAILDRLNSWFQDRPIEEVFQHYTQYKQEQIGWYPFLKGLWHVQWAQDQQAYLLLHKKASRTKNGSLWMHHIQQFILQAMHQLWTEHTHSIHQPAEGQTALHLRLYKKNSRPARVTLRVMSP